MKRSLSAGSGHLLIDHRASPGLTPADLAHLPGAVAVGEGQTFERDIQQCSHCQRGVILEPLRTRARGYCPKCDHYLCDACEALRAASGGACIPFKQQLDTLATALETASRSGDPLALPPILLTDPL